jgi:hypothetical protein
MAELIHVETTKFPDRPHWRFDVLALGQDEFGTWVQAPTGTHIQRGSEQPFALTSGFVGLIPGDDWWMVEFYPDHPTITMYVNIGTPPKWNDTTVTQIDLDLDVVRRLDDRVEIIDQDEFEENRATHGYPDELVEGAIEAANRAVALAQAGVAPFDEVAARWIERAFGSK